MSTELIVSEKPNAAKKIAEALAKGSPTKENINGVPYYLLNHNGQNIIVGCAVGHLYGLKEKSKDKFPNFDIDWIPKADIGRKKKADFSKKYLNTLKKLAKKCDKFTVATDYDIEGEVIGLNVIRFAAKQKDACRMKFSTLTKGELVNSYENKEKTLYWGQANAGETRHKLDWYYGINLSQALTNSIKKAGTFKILSTGRVQGPALKMLADKENEIRAFKPEPYWELELKGKLNSNAILASHQKGKFQDEKEVLEILDKTQGKEAKLADIKSREMKVQPPVPFDLTSLQVEAYGKIKIPPKKTLSIAQELYTSGWISYPRTSSQELPDSIGFKKILQMLNKQPCFKGETEYLLNKKTLKPNNGKKKDAAHPAIYPTGLIPEGITGKERQLYDLIARRFMATFGEPATRETVTYTIDCNSEKFILKGTLTKVKGWMELYGEFAKQKEEELPKAKVGDDINNPKITKLDKMTTPPKRYTEASIIKELEKRGLGTKATRASIIDTLFQRNYVEGKKLEVTDLGLKISDILVKNVPKITDEAMTKSFEEDMEAIREHKKKPEEVLKKAEKVITEIVSDFKDNENIGTNLKDTFFETKDKMETIGKCPNCENGTLKIRKGKFGRFIACDQYPDCKTTYGLPNVGLVKPCEDKCEVCGGVMITIIKSKGPQKVCLNKECPSKKIDESLKKDEGKKCPKCGKGKLVERKGIYGSFMACDQYPKCKFIEAANHTPKKEEEEDISTKE
ncbi:DNA topoisomerase I [Candidatus Woesearchaeota archaeon]|nr:DNA topoisomerase I [Candidatus Woesearchaeota archaeon]